MNDVRPLQSFLFGSSSVLVTALAVLACSGSDDSGFSSQSSEGTERGPCRSGRTCDPGLVCLSDICVRMPDGGVPANGGASTGTGGASNGGQKSSGGSPGGGGGTANGGSSGNGGSPSDGGSASGGAAGTGTGGGSSGAGGTPSSGGANGSDSGVQCRGSHPNVQGQRRFCDVGSCYCTDPFDSCFTGSTADACCNKTPICGDSQSGGGVDCVGAHPIIGPPRTCSPGFCLCSDGSTVDACYPANVADACCPPRITPVCVPN